jgi:apolipoprotein N-acyltransferase
MAREANWFDRATEHEDATEIIPVVSDDDDNTGAIAIEADDDTGAIAIEADDDTGADLELDEDARDSLETPAAEDDVTDSSTAFSSTVRQRLQQLGTLMLARLAVLGTALLARLPRLGRALLPRLPRLGATVAAGLLLCASFPPLGWWWAAVVAFALLAWVLTRRATTPAGGLGYGFLFGVTFYLPLLPWIGNLVGAMPWLALGVMCAVFPGLFGLLAVVVRRLPGWPVWFAALWVAQEWLKSSVPFGGFPWGVVGFGQTDGPFLPLVRLGGVPLLSAAIVLMGCSATVIASEIALWWQATSKARSSSGGSGVEGTDGNTRGAGPPPAVVLPGICICLVLFATVIIWPQVRRAGMGSGDEPAVTVAAIQGNVPRLGLGFNAQRRAVLDNHVRETLRLADDVHAGLAPQPQFVIWPEDSSDIDPLVNADAGQQISAAATAIGVPILVGTVLDVPDRPPDKPENTNTVIVWNPVTGPADHHNKQIVQPFGEYLPWRGFFRHLSGFADLAGYMVPGKSTGVVHAAGVPIGIATCWEAIFDRAPREAVRNGAQLLAVPSNNATFNKTMSEQQLAFDKVRAVEHDRYVVVAGTVGISAVIAPDGRELDRTDFFEPTYLDTQVRLKTALTPATRWGPIVQWTLVAAGVAAAFAAIRQNGWFRRPNRRRFWPANDSGAPPGGSEDDTPPDEGEDDTPPDEGGRNSARFGRHRGAT